MYKLKNKFINFFSDDRGIGVVEMVLILVVLIGLVVIFKTKLNSLITSVFTDISRKVGTL